MLANFSMHPLCIWVAVNLIVSEFDGNCLFVLLNFRYFAPQILDIINAQSWVWNHLNIWGSESTIYVLN